MTELEQRAESALAGLREGFQADGADLELVGVEGGRARVRLLVTEETCLECIVERPILEQVVAAALQASCPELSGIDLEDPRT